MPGFEALFEREGRRLARGSMMRQRQLAALPKDERHNTERRPQVPDIHIAREHALGLPRGAQAGLPWAEVAEEKLDMECTYEEGKTADLVSFTRPGANGELKVTKDRFELDARLGFLLGAFKDRIEGEIVKNLDVLLAQKDPLKAFEQGWRGTREAPAPSRTEAPRPLQARKAPLRKANGVSSASRSGRCTAAWRRRCECPSGRSRRPTWRGPPCRRSPASFRCCRPVACLYRP